MNNPDKHIEPWSIKDVQKYLNGELSAPEMHELEKLALDDPFLADALEGLQTQPGPVLQQDLGELRTRLDARVTTRSKKMRLLPFLRVAAVLILLVGLGFTTFYTLFNRNPSARESGATAKASAPTAATPPAASPAAPTAPSPEAKASAPPATVSAPEREAKASAAPPSASAPTRLAETRRAKPAPSPQSQPVAAADPSGRNAQFADSMAYRNNLNDVVVRGYGEKPRADREDAFIKPVLPSMVIRKDTTNYNSALFDKKTFGAANPSNLVVFSGKVLDFNNRPVAGASVLFKSNEAVAVTDGKGQFNLYLPPKDTTRHLTIAMEGYEAAQYALNTDDMTGNVIFLRQNQSPPKLDEVVVSGLGSKRKEVMAAPPSDEPEKLDSLWLNTTPVMGHNAYLAYLEYGKKTLAVDTAIHGTESISFLVDRKGTLSEFKIERSLSPAHDAGVIRLINEGPPWKLQRGRAARALVNVTFP